MTVSSTPIRAGLGWAGNRPFSFKNPHFKNPTNQNGMTFMRPTRYSLPVNLLLAELPPRPAPEIDQPSDLTAPLPKALPRPVPRVIRLFENRIPQHDQDAGASV